LRGNVAGAGKLSASELQGLSPAVIDPTTAE
jgi:hypothetical protein